ncbi:hypothetical protein [Listeria cossartiae]|uniref:hypothetical protein n=1 Tax=Listeria cossartiae TaxID=2838249 RepID=UPI0021ADAAEC|nr:hypothetical protein [Listeria cossartiae]
MMKKKIIMITLGTVCILSVLCMYNYHPIKFSFWLENASLEEQSRYFLQTKFDKKWKSMNSNIEFEFNQESGHNSLQLNNYSVQTQVADKRDDILNTVIEKRNTHAMILFSTKLENKMEVQSPIDKNGTLHVWENIDLNSEKTIYDIPIKNGAFKSNERMEQELGIKTDVVVKEVEKNRVQYNFLLNELKEKELNNIIIERNFRLLMSSLFILSVVVVSIAIRYFKNRRTRKMENFYLELEKESK